MMLMRMLNIVLVVLDVLVVLVGLNILVRLD